MEEEEEEALSRLRTTPAAPAESRRQRRKRQKAQRLASASTSASPSAPPTKADPNPDEEPGISYAPCPSAADGPCGCSGAVCCRLRVVEPYVHTFSCTAKRRWLGQPLLELFRDEFGLSAGYCAAAVRMGLIRVNGAAQAADYVLRDGDRVAHTMHRHEPAAHIADARGTSPADPSQSQDSSRCPSRDPPSLVVLAESAGLVAVNKPSGVPVHPSGVLLHNSLTQWLASERPVPGGYRPVHRLDRLTSGLTLLATSAETAAAVGQQIAARAVRKHYVALVRGSFPSTDPSADGTAAFSPQWAVSEADGSASLSVVPAAEGNWWRLEAPLESLGPSQQHRRRVGATPGRSKPSESLFRVLRTTGGGRESVVECVPVTGRTHQLRVHLEFLGFPISHDPLYGSVAAHSPPSAPERVETPATTSDALVGDALVADPLTADALAAAAKALCARCRSAPTVDGDSDDADARPALRLHAFRYLSDTWEFSAPLPAWATSS